MTHGQAEVVRELLVRHGLVKMPTTGILPTEWTVSSGNSPPERDYHVTVYGTGSVGQARLLRDGRRVEYPTVQVSVRALKEAQGWVKAREIEDLFDRIGASERVDKLPPQAIVIEQSRYVIRSVFVTTTTTRMGMDENNRRVILTLNAQLFMGYSELAPTFDSGTYRFDSTAFTMDAA